MLSNGSEGDNIQQIIYYFGNDKPDAVHKYLEQR